MNYCPKCGTAVVPNSMFCAKCGYALQGERSAVVAAGPTTVRVANNLGIVGATKLFVKDAFVFKGRMSRANYWWSTLAIWLVTNGLNLITYLSTGMLVANNWSGILVQVLGLVLIIPELSAMVRRLHDINRKGTAVWWLFLPIIGSIYMLVLLVRAGDQQVNYYG